MPLESNPPQAPRAHDADATASPRGARRESARRPSLARRLFPARRPFSAARTRPSKALAAACALSFVCAAIFAPGASSARGPRVSAAQDRRGSPAGLAQDRPAQVRPAQDRPAQDRPAEEGGLERLLRGRERAKTIAQIPAEFVAAVRREYERSPAAQRETKFEPYLASRYAAAADALDLRIGIGPPPVRSASMCANGTCDGPLNPGVWAGAWTGGAATNISDPNLPVATWTAGLVPNNNSTSPTSCGAHNTQAHHSIVPAGNDPVVPSIKTVAPVPATGNVSSLRLGNQCTLYGGEKVAKTFVVPAGVKTLQFWFATVLQNPDGHPPAAQPGFGAFLLPGGATTPLPNRIDLDAATPGQQGFIAADKNNPFFGVAAGGAIVYRDWTCVTVDLSGLEGQAVTLVLANRDCGYGGHWGYSYVDSFCLGCEGNPTGDASFNPEKSDCAKGQVCFNYTVPKLPSGATGQVNLTLELYQNGALVNTLNSGPLNSNGTYCFSNVLAGLAASAGGFDWKATANFTVAGATIAPKVIGVTGEGNVAGKNNDCRFPPPPVDPCCPPWNKDLLKEMLFYQGSGSISAPYTLKFQPTQQFKDQMQQYLNYVHSINPSITAITIAFRLHDQGTANPPYTFWGAQITPTAFVSWTWNTTGVGNPAVSPATGFFVPPAYPASPMQVGNWYAVTSGIYFEGGHKFFPEKCAEATVYVRVQVLASRPASGQPGGQTLEFSDGRDVIKRVPVGEGGPPRQQR
jgi:hypothetical protein